MKSISSTQPMTMEVLDARVKTLLPEDYHDFYEDIQPVSMGSAGLKYGKDGKVAWDDIWGSFCDLAMAGGPPHKGKLLEPGARDAIALQPEQYGRVVEEIRRGIQMVAYLPTKRLSTDGWIRVECDTSVKAGWLVRAIAMENISTRCHGSSVELPAGPDYRIEKEVKNVITSVAKTCHYWDDHMSLSQQARIRDLFARMNAESPFVQPALPGAVNAADYERVSNEIGAAIQGSTGLRTSNDKYFGWLGLDCPDVRAAVWMMRALVACNLLSRREGNTLFVPVNPADDSNARAVERSVASVYGFASVRGFL